MCLSSAMLHRQNVKQLRQRQRLQGLKCGYAECEAQRAKNREVSEKGK